MTTKKNFNDATLNIRLPDAVLKQFEQIAHGIYKTPSELTRNLIVDYVNNRKDIITALNSEQGRPRQPQQRAYPTQGMYPTGNNMPADDEWM